MASYPELRKMRLSTRIAFDAFWFADHCFGPARVDAVFGSVRTRLRTRGLREMKALGEGRRFPIPRVSGVSLKEFRREYLGRGRPVILAGAAAEWACVKTWTPKRIADRFGDDAVALIDASPERLEATNYQLEFTTLREVIESMGNGPLSKYSRFNTLFKDHPELLADVDMRFLQERRNLFASGKTFQVFIGGGGTKTHIHAASEHNLFTQAYGRKHWLIFPPSYDGLIDPSVTRTPYFVTAYDPDAPDYAKYPGMRYADGLEGTLEPGDVLFVPPSWWHHVKNPEDSIGFGFRWFSAHDSFRRDFMMALLMILAVDPPIWTATRHRGDFTKIFSYRANRARKKARRDAELAEKT